MIVARRGAHHGTVGDVVVERRAAITTVKTGSGRWWRSQEASAVRPLGKQERITAVVNEFVAHVLDDDVGSKDSFKNAEGLT